MRGEGERPRTLGASFQVSNTTLINIQEEKEAANHVKIPPFGKTNQIQRNKTVGDKSRKQELMEEECMSGNWIEEATFASSSSRID